MGKKLFIIVFHNPWNWSADFANQTANELSKNNYVVCVLLGDAKSVKEYIFSNDKHPFYTFIAPQLYAFTPLYIIPFIRFEVIHEMNIRFNIFLIKLWIFFFTFKHTIQNKYIWIFYPKHNKFLSAFGKSFSIIYDCVDYFAGSATHVDMKIIAEENQIIQKAKHFFVNSKVLFNVHKAVRKAFIVPQGFRKENLTTIKNKQRVRKFNNKPTIGYVGAINTRLNFVLLERIITNHPEWNFVFWGNVQEIELNDHASTYNKFEKIKKYSNVTTGFSSNKKEIPTIIKQFDIGIIPYNTNTFFNKYCYPMKLFEYFYMGKPVVATPIQELKRFPKYVKMGTSAKDWENNIKYLLNNHWPHKYQLEQRRLAENNSWKRKIDIILRSIDEVPSKQTVKKMP